MSTYRERREAKAERLREWADKREAKGTARLEGARQLQDQIPLGQPILVGHHSEGRHRRHLERIENGTRAGLEHLDKAAEFRRRAANIEAAADRAIYSDDEDAIERLREKIAGLEDERDRIKRFNASARKAAKVDGGTPEFEILTEKQREEWRTLARVASWQLRAGGQFPAYATSNIGKTINTAKQRLEKLEREREGQ